MLGYVNGTFANSRTLSTGWLSHPSSVVVGDFNNDHQLDIAVTNFGSNNVGIFLGYGNRTFSSQQITTTKNSRPLSIAIGDFNGDKRIDIIVVNYGTNSIGVLLEFGNGTFGYPTIYSTGFDSDPQSIAVADLNNDSQLDLVVANRSTNNIAIFLGNTDGTFENHRMYFTNSGSSPYSVTTGDLNNDNCLDIVVANSGSDTVGVFLGYGNGDFAHQMMYTTGNGYVPYFSVVDDLNNDTRRDIVVGNYGTDSISILLRYGNGSFTRSVTYSIDSLFRPTSLGICDFNKDKRLDIVITSSGSNELFILFGIGDRTFADQTTISMGYGAMPIFLTCSDMNDDQWSDIAVVNYEFKNIEVYIPVC